MLRHFCSKTLVSPSLLLHRCISKIVFFFNICWTFWKSTSSCLCNLGRGGLLDRRIRGGIIRAFTVYNLNEWFHFRKWFRKRRWRRGNWNPNRRFQHRSAVLPGMRGEETGEFPNKRSYIWHWQQSEGMLLWNKNDQNCAIKYMESYVYTRYLFLFKTEHSNTWNTTSIAAVAVGLIFPIYGTLKCFLVNFDPYLGFLKNLKIVF